jgi:hypothetical protein
METAFTSFIQDVKSRQFPGPEHSVDMPDEEWEALNREGSYGEI